MWSALAKRSDDSALDSDIVQALAPIQSGVALTLAAALQNVAGA
jgi:hypothetical protein